MKKLSSVGVLHALQTGMKYECPNKQCPRHHRSEIRNNSVHKKGLFHRRSDRKWVQRYHCTLCLRSFSTATYSINRYQKKRHLNHKIARLLVAGVSQRECQRIFKINRKTVIKKFLVMSERAELKLHELNKKRNKTTIMQFDDMETFEHTKLKPISVTLAVEENSRYILGFRVAQMPAKGLLSKKSVLKYGKRLDERFKERKILFQNIQSFLENGCLIKSDENPHYINDVKKYFPNSEHLQYKGGRGCIVGQGELKKLGFDPLFSLNHTCATFRARANRLFRKTWCTTKKKERLARHLNLVILHHNLNLKPPLISPN